MSPQAGLAFKAVINHVHNMDNYHCEKEVPVGFLYVDSTAKSLEECETALWDPSQGNTP